MSLAIAWTSRADQQLLQLRAAGVPWPTVARSLHVGRSAAIERARTLGLRPANRMPQPKPANPQDRLDRPPLPAGHPITWGAITNQTAIDGAAYPFPVFV